MYTCKAYSVNYLRVITLYIFLFLATVLATGLVIVTLFSKEDTQVMIGAILWFCLIPVLYFVAVWLAARRFVVTLYPDKAILELKDRNNFVSVVDMKKARSEVRLAGDTPQYLLLEQPFSTLKLRKHIFKVQSNDEFEKLTLQVMNILGQQRIERIIKIGKAVNTPKTNFSMVTAYGVRQYGGWRALGVLASIGVNLAVIFYLLDNYFFDNGAVFFALVAEIALAGWIFPSLLSRKMELNIYEDRLTVRTLKTKTFESKQSVTLLYKDIKKVIVNDPHEGKKYMIITTGDGHKYYLKEGRCRQRRTMLNHWFIEAFTELLELYVIKNKGEVKTDKLKGRTIDTTTLEVVLDVVEISNSLPD